MKKIIIKKAPPLDVLGKINAGHYTARMSAAAKTNLSKAEQLVIRAQYAKDERDLRVRFEQDLAEEHGVSNHPKAALLFEKAWAMGHGTGLRDVVLAYEDLVDLIKD